MQFLAAGSSTAASNDVAGNYRCSIFQHIVGNVGFVPRSTSPRTITDIARAIRSGLPRRAGQLAVYPEIVDTVCSLLQSVLSSGYFFGSRE